jgi:hypothetical protein
LEGKFAAASGRKRKPREDDEEFIVPDDDIEYEDSGSSTDGSDSEEEAPPKETNQGPISLSEFAKSAARLQGLEKTQNKVDKQSDHAKMKKVTGKLAYKKSKQAPKRGRKKKDPKPKNSTPAPRRRFTWTNEEDIMLLEEIAKQKMLDPKTNKITATGKNLDYATIAKNMDKSAAAVRLRFTNVLSKIPWVKQALELAVAQRDFLNTGPSGQVCLILDYLHY